MPSPTGPATAASTSSPAWSRASASTKAAKTLLGKISERKNLLLVVERADEAAWLSARNLPQVHILEPGQLNTYDVLVSDDVVFTQAAFESFVSGPKAD